MTPTITRLALASILTMGGVAVASAAPIVTNGSFETGTLSGWTVVGGGTTPGIGVTVLTTGGSNTTGYGDNVPDFAGTHAAYFVDDNANETLSQDVSLTGGDSYTVSFALFATASGAANPFSFTLTNSLGASTLSTLINSGSMTDVPVGAWTPYSYTFTAPSDSSYELAFNFVSGSTPAKDVLLDAVVIAPSGSTRSVPEPASIALLGLGIGAIGFLRRRKAA
jgi:hypothetical protein